MQILLIMIIRIFKIICIQQKVQQRGRRFSVSRRLSASQAFVFLHKCSQTPTATTSQAKRPLEQIFRANLKRSISTVQISATGNYKALYVQRPGNIQPKQRIYLALRLIHYIYMCSVEVGAGAMRSAKAASCAIVQQGMFVQCQVAQRTQVASSFSLSPPLPPSSPFLPSSSLLCNEECAVSGCSEDRGCMCS